MKKLINTLKDEAFKNNRFYEGEVVDLREKYRVSETVAFDGVPTIYYEILKHGTNYRVGKCDLRLKLDERMYYYGHVGYNVNKEDRGHHYAYYACKILFDIARDEFNQKELIVTCNPDNDASYKTLKKLGGELVEVAEIPKNHELYRQGDTYKCVFRYKMDLENGKVK